MHFLHVILHFNLFVHKWVFFLCARSRTQKSVLLIGLEQSFKTKARHCVILRSDLLQNDMLIGKREVWVRPASLVAKRNKGLMTHCYICIWVWLSSVVPKRNNVHVYRILMDNNLWGLILNLVTRQSVFFKHLCNFEILVLLFNNMSS